MPDLTGYDVLHLLQERLSEHVPIVAHTIHVSEFNTARERGIHSFINKPISFERFSDQLNRIMSGERVWELS